MGSLFKSNTGKVDRIIRIIVGALLVGNVFVGGASSEGPFCSSCVSDGEEVD